MQKITFFLLLFTISFALRAQRSISDSLTADSIDSAINHTLLDQTKLIFITTNGLKIDSALFRKISYTSDKEKIKITFADNTSIKIKAEDFWGLVTDFGQSQRFYKGKIYILWHTKTPYVYREYSSSDRKINYFYSRTLISEIIPLTKENVYDIVDARTIEQLQAYLKTHDIETSKGGGGISIGTTGLPFSEFFSDDNEATPQLFDLLIFHIRLHLYALELLGELENLR